MARKKGGRPARPSQPPQCDADGPRQDLTPEEWVECYRRMSPQDQRTAWRLLARAEGLPPWDELQRRERNFQSAAEWHDKMLREERAKHSRRSEEDEETILETFRLARNLSQPKVAEQLKLSLATVRMRLRVGRALAYQHGLYPFSK
jgi:hypothetical protein